MKLFETTLRTFYGFLFWLVALDAAAQKPVFNHLTVENGLPGSSIIAITQDADGFMWYGTQNNGLSKYDGVNFTNYINISDKPGSLSGNTVSALLRASDGRLWIGTSRGINIYNSKKDKFDKIPSHTLSDSTIYCIYEDSDKNIWIGTKKGLHLLVDKSRYTFKLISGPGVQYPNGRSVRCIFEDKDKNLWAGTQNGLIKITDKQHPLRIKEYQHDENPGSITGNYVTSIVEDASHQIWIGTHDNGLNKYDKSLDTFQHYLQKSKGVINNNIRKLVVDKGGNMWIGTQEGLSIMNSKSGQLISYIHHPQDGRSISNNSIHSIYQDANQNMWIGTYFGGVNVAYAYNTPFEVHQYSEPGLSISNNVVSSIIEDNDQNLWIGTEGGGLNYYNLKTGSYTAYKNDPDDSRTISSNLIKKVYKDSRQNIWIGTSYNKGLNMLDTKSKTFRRFTVSQRDASSYDEITAILEDSYGQIWIGGQSGLYVVEKKGDTYNQILQPAHYPLLQGKDVHTLYEDPQKNLWIGTSAGLYMLNRRNNNILPAFKEVLLATANVNCIVADQKGFIWIATRNLGLIQWNSNSNTLTRFTTNEGLSDNNIWGIVEDDQMNLWLSTENGISKFVRSAASFINYDTYDGLPGNKFNINAYCKDHNSRIFFGGYNGLVSFLPRNIETNRFISPLRFTALRLFNKVVMAGDETNLLKSTITTSQKISFGNSQNVFTIDFAILNYIKPRKNRYAYKLDDFDKQWNYTQNTSATYTNLPPGNYTFLLKAANNDGVWGNETASITIKVKPPIWGTWWAYTLYILLAAAVLFFVTRFIYLRALFKKEYELQQLKLNFFTNISHEIRTHLTLILAPVEKLSFINKDNSKATEMLKHIKTNATRLLELVVELMDFRKAETNNLPLHVTKENINLLLADIAGSFHETAAGRCIQFHVENNSVSELYFDKNQMNKVFFNLLSNAFKFTPDGGKIKLAIHDMADDVHIKVTDSGKGIALENIKKIFTRYYQVEDNATNDTGYGIGLALSKALTELHKGQLLVASTPATGNSEGRTCFTVILRKGTTHFSKQQLLPLKQTDHQWEPPAEIQDEMLLAETNKKPVVLTVEDNPEVRHFIKDALEEAYTILEAADGKAGLAIAFEQVPDIVVSDVMMPEMDGLRFCHLLKTDERTSHIPFILLTAKSGQEHQVKGLEYGADLYITKPFSLEMLELQVRNLLSARMAMQQKYSRQLFLEPQGIPINNKDEHFLKKLLDIVEAHIGDPELGVTMLTEKVAMSKPVLYKKLKALTNMSVHDFIISIRLKKAALLLEQRQLNVSEIAYEVGYSDRKYFSKEFKRLFGKSPTEFADGENVTY